MDTIKRLSIIIFFGVSSFFFIQSFPVKADNHEAIFIKKTDLVVFSNDEILKVVEVLSYVNNDQRDHLEINIPENAKNFSLFGGLDQTKVKITDNQLVYDGTLPDGEFSITYGYNLALDQNSHASLTYKQPYWVRESNISIPVGQLTVNGEKFHTQSNIIELEGLKLRQFRRVDLSKNTDWILSFQQSAFKQVTGSDSHSTKGETTKNGLPIIAHTHGGNPKEAFFNILFIILILILGIISIRFSSNSKQLVLKGKAKQLIERDMILDELQQLQEQKDRDELSDDEYKQLFQLRYKRLKEIAIILEGE